MFIWSHVPDEDFNKIYFTIVVNTYFTYFCPKYMYRSLGDSGGGVVFRH